MKAAGVTILPPARNAASFAAPAIRGRCLPRIAAVALRSLKAPIWARFSPKSTSKRKDKTMSFDMNDAEPQKSGEIIPDGTFAKVCLTIRKGTVDGESEIDKGLLKASNSPGSDVLMLDCEFTVAEGPHVRRKFWQMRT